MKFRIWIQRDPEARKRGYSLKGIKVPLTNYCPVKPNNDTVGYDNKPVYGHVHVEFWRIPVDHIAKANPEAGKHLTDTDYLLVPVAWCDVGPSNQEEFDRFYQTGKM